MELSRVSQMPPRLVAAPQLFLQRRFTQNSTLFLVHNSNNKSKVTLLLKHEQSKALATKAAAAAVAAETRTTTNMVKAIRVYEHGGPEVINFFLSIKSHFIFHLLYPICYIIGSNYSPFKKP